MRPGRQHGARCYLSLQEIVRTLVLTLNEMVSHWRGGFWLENEIVPDLYLKFL